MRLTVDSLNNKYWGYLSRMCSGKGKFGLYNVTMKNGRVVIGSTLKDLEEGIKGEIKKIESK